MPVASFHMDILGRAGGRSPQRQAAYGSGSRIKTVPIASIVAAASYRAGEALRDGQLERTFDYSEREDVRYEALMLPDHAPTWAADRETYWNAVDTRERHPRAQLARSLMVALPRELSLADHIALLREFVHQQFVAKGVVADVAIHDKEASDGGRNPHANVLVSMRGFNEDGTWKKQKARELNGYDETRTRDAQGNHLPPARRFFSLDHWREAWERLQNQYLAEAGSTARVSLQSYQKQGIDRIPTVHMGFQAWHKEQRGIATDVGNYNRWVRATNAQSLPHAANDAPDQKPQARETLPPHTPPTEEQTATPRQTVGTAHTRLPDWDVHWQRIKQKVAGWHTGWEQHADTLRAWGNSLTPRRAYEQVRDRVLGVPPRGEEAARATPAPYRPKPRYVWSQEQRDDYRQLHPYLQRHADLTRQEQAKAVAVTLEYAQQQRAQARRAAMEQIAQQRANVRHRAIVQDRPPPHAQHERTRQRGR